MTNMLTCAAFYYQHYAVQYFSSVRYLNMQNMDQQMAWVIRNCQDLSKIWSAIVKMLEYLTYFCKCFCE